MILSLEELEGKALDWVLDIAMYGHHPHRNATRRERNGRMEVLIEDDCSPPGWIHYQTRIVTEQDVADAKAIILQRLGDGFYVVPNNLVLSAYAHIKHEPYKSPYDWVGFYLKR